MRPSYWSGAIEPREADLAIVGAGFAGLSTALHCAAARPNARIVVIERHEAGAGASGRNGGMIIPFPMIPLWLVPGAANGAAAEANRMLMDVLEATLSGPVGLAVDARPADVVIAATGIIWRKGLNWVAARADSMGVGVESLGLRELEERYSQTSTLGLRYPGHRIQPWQSAQRLAEAARQLGVEILSGVEVLALRSEPHGTRLNTDSGDIVARQVVLATNAYGASLGGKLPGSAVFSYVLASEPLPPADAHALGGGNALVVELDRGIYRRIEDGRLIFGALDKTGRSVNEATATDPSARAELRRLLRNSLPQLADVEIAREWGGAFAQRIGAPLVAKHPSMPEVYYNSGYGGSGVGLSLLSGALVQGLIWPDADDHRAAFLRRAYAQTRVPWMRLPAVGLDVLRLPTPRLMDHKAK
jgi:glycine/D-amino acid oxidase-like deaminating enzyme